MVRWQQGVSSLALLIHSTPSYTPTHSFGTLCGTVIDIYFHHSCVKLLLWFSWRRWLRTVSHSWKSTSPRAILLRGAAPWLHFGKFISTTVTAFGEKTIFFSPPEKHVTNKRTADVIRINHPTKRNPNVHWLVSLSKLVIINLKLHHWEKNHPTCNRLVTVINRLGAIILRKIFILRWTL